MQDAMARARPDRLILVYNADSGVRALLLDVIKKAVGREDCTLCEITHGPFGKRPAFQKCEQSLGVPVDALHRDELPHSWGIGEHELPCVLGRIGNDRPFIIVTRQEIASCDGKVAKLEAKLAAVLSRANGQ